MDLLPSKDRSGAARSRHAQPYVSPDPLLSARAAAVETGRGLSTFWRDVKAGKLPPAIYVRQRSPRWRLSELSQAVEQCRTEYSRAVQHHAEHADRGGRLTKGAQSSPRSPP